MDVSLSVKMSNYRASMSDTGDRRFTETAYKSFAAGFHCGDFRQIGWQFVRIKSFDVHFDQADEWATEVRFRLTASIDNYAYRINDTAARTNDLDRFLDAAAARDDILDDDKSFLRRNLETATQDKFAILFF